MKHIRLVAAALSIAASICTAIPGWAQTPQEILKSLTYRHGPIDIHNGIASLDLPSGYSYLDPNDAETFLTKIYGNPPSKNGPDTDGMILPDNIDPLSADGWAVVVSYDDAGHVSDSDASTANYDDLLKTMQQRAEDSNPERQKAGYDPIHLIGWAEPPRYDSAAKTVYWAERFKFGNSTTDTLNYKIRILGREGVLELNVVDSIDHLSRIRTLTPALLTMASFNSGKSYADYNPSTDHTAEYGIAGLIAGGILLKTGFLKALLVGIAALWKPIAIGAVAVLGGIARFFRRGPRIKTDA